MFRKIGKKRGVAALSVIAVLAIAGAAFAYFTSTGSGTGNAAVGNSTAFTVAQTSTSGNMYPGAGTSTLNYTVTNPSAGHQNLSAVVATVNSNSSSDITTHGGTDVPGCLASWFTAVAHPGSLPQDLAGSGTSTGTVTVTMTNTPTISQDACQGATPDITISAS
jgi:hypothetical protein